MYYQITALFVLQMEKLPNIYLNLPILDNVHLQVIYNNVAKLIIFF